VNALRGVGLTLAVGTAVILGLAVVSFFAGRWWR
jgi:hypothetical protein